ncbi:glycosyltransferase family 4 protein [Nonlabens ulvanivorans]|uniref:glycosyltransferase family 4 protein n=1 Tax=Nonlabens ulvanivorans TaxID=906888 RepID=UPI002942F2DC|nr:glycosyltransferase family 4 protein [Nonlabens ulvanivorans]WOI22397.1 glycosyltransferase family 4 protein [Nonlabens ulvanivorans]
MSKKRILLIGPFPEPTTGVSLANQVVYDEFSKNDAFEVSKVNTSFSSFDEKLGAVSFKKLWFYLKLQVYFLKVFQNDIIYITPGQTFFGVVKYALYILAATLSRKQILQHIHGNFLGKQYHLLSGIKKKVFYYLMSKTDKGIVLSESLKPNFEPFIASKDIYVLKNFVIDELFFDDEVIKKKDYNSLKIVYLSNLMAEKGIFDLLESLTMLEKKNIPYSAKIAGNIAPENQQKANSYFNKLQHTEYIGVVGKEQKAELFKWSNVFVLPTYYTMEGQPISILEAMATGNVVLTTPHAGIPDIFKNEINGFYVVIQNPESITKQVEHIIDHKDDLVTIAIYNVKEAREAYRVRKFVYNLQEIIKA